MAELIVRIGGDNSGFAAVANQTVGIGRKLAKDLGSTLAGRVGAAGALYAIQRASKEAIGFASDMTDSAAAVSTTTDRMQELNYAATQSGARSNDMVTAMRNLAAARQDALKNPGGDKAQAFAGIGIGPQELAALTDMGNLLFRVGDAVKGVNLDANSLPQILSLIGARNMAVLPAMKAGLREAADEAHRLNLILGKDTVSSLDKLGDSTDRAILKLKRPIAELVLFLAKALTTIQTGIEQLPALAELVAGQIAVAMSKIQIVFDKSPEAKRVLKLAEERVAFAKSELDRLSNEHANIYDPTVGARPKPGTAPDDPDAKADAEGAALESRRADRMSKLYLEINDINQRLSRVRMSDAEVLADMTREMERQQNYRDITADERDADPLDLMEQDKRIAEMKLAIEERKVIEERKANEKKPDERGDPFHMNADSATRVGQFIGGSTPGLINDLLGRQQITETRKIVANTARISEKIDQQNALLRASDPWA